MRRRFALTILQRRLASSAAIHESLRRRRERLEARLAEERLMKRGQEARLAAEPTLPTWSEEDEAEIEDAPGDEAEAAEEAILDQATAARTIAELETEIETLRQLEAQPAALCQSRPLRASREAFNDSTAPTRPSQIAARSFSKPGRLANSHQPLRRRERSMQRFRRMRTLQVFAAVHSSVHNHFDRERHLYSRKNFKRNQTAALATWRQLGAG